MAALPNLVPDSDVSATVSYPPSGPYEFNMDVVAKPQRKAPPAEMSNDAAANLVSYYESGNKNIPNYRYDPWHTAGGYFQITDTNWRKYAPQVGVDLNQHPNAMSGDYATQRAVFDRMYQVEGLAPWVNYNPRLAEAVGSGRVPTPGWTPSPRALASEQDRSNTDVRYMTPEEYLSLLPPLEDNSANRAKRDNLQKSLEVGDNIEQIPSLDVTPRGDNLHVADWDGRNRAQAAINAGVDEIPVAVRGIPQEKRNDFKLLVGNGKRVSLPYTFTPVPKPAPVPIPQLDATKVAASIIPRAFVPPAPRAGELALPGQLSPTPSSVQPSKPNFYPEIAAGINKDIINPAGIGYRGTSVPDLATNTTPGGRIAAANTGSAGQIGLGGQIGSVLSALNPIGSAQAAEMPPAGGVPNLVPDIAPSSPVPTLRPDTPSMGSFDYTGLNTVAPPLANFLAAPATAAAGDIGALFQHPQSMADWAQKAAAIQGRMQVPETPAGQVISNVLQSPGALLAWGIREVVGADRTAAAYPYVKPVMDVLPFLGLGAAGSGVANALSRPTQVLARSLIPASREIQAARALNRLQPAEEAAGGMTVPQMRSALSQARGAGIPAAPLDFSVPGGPQDAFLRQALEHSPEAGAKLGNFLSKRIEGVPARSPAAPVGSTLSRMEARDEASFGPGSAHDRRKDLKDQQIIAGIGLRAIENQMAQRIKILQGIYKKLTPTQIAKDPDIVRLVGRQKIQEKAIEDLKQAKRGLDLGTSLFKSSVRAEDIRDYLRTAKPDGKAALQLGVKDALRQEYRKTSTGEEPQVVIGDQTSRDKVTQAFGGATRKAQEAIDAARLEDRLSRRSKNLLAGIRKEASLTLADKSDLARVAEAGFHAATSLATGHFGGVFFWTSRAARFLYNMAKRGGGVAARIGGEEIARIMSDPNARLATGGKGLLQVPSKPLPNVLGRGNPWMSYGFLAPQPEAQVQQ